MSFGFQARARYPGANVSVAFYSVADWHIPSNQNQNLIVDNAEPFFVPDSSWHLYVNTTREQLMVASEVLQVLAKMEALKNDDDGVSHFVDKGLDKSSSSSTSTSLSPSSASNRLRSRKRNTDASRNISREKARLLKAQEKAGWLLGLFGIAKYPELHVPLIPTVTRPLLQIAGDDKELDDIRILALEILLAVTDSYTAPVILQSEFHLLSHMQAIITNVPGGGGGGKETKDDHQILWDDVKIMALDLISNMALHRTKSHPYSIPTGLWNLLERTAQESSGTVIGLQASLAMIHFWGTGNLGTATTKTTASKIGSIPKKTAISLLELLEATIDGDPVFGYEWDLLPGPLSAIQFLVAQAAKSPADEDDHDPSPRNLWQHPILSIRC